MKVGAIARSAGQCPHSEPLLRIKRDKDRIRAIAQYRFFLALLSSKLISTSSSRAHGRQRFESISRTNM